MVVIQARLGSTRCPEKVLEVVGDFPVLFHVLMRAKHALPWAHVVIAAPESDVKRMREYCVGEFYGWRGADNDVLGRFHAAVGLRDVTTIVRLTADCPFVGVDGIKAVADAVQSGEAEYAWTGDQVNGLDAEAFTRDMLTLANRRATKSHDREHVTPWMRANANRIYRYEGYDHFKRYRWTLDTPDDLAWMQAVARMTDVTPPDPSPEKLHELAHLHPELMRLDHAA